MNAAHHPAITVGAAPSATPPHTAPLHLASQFVIFGLTGDLARKKLLPALYALLAAGLLPDSTHIVGVTRRAVTTDDILSPLRDNPAYDPPTLDRLASIIHMFQMDLTETSDYAKLRAFLDAQEAKYGQCFHRLLYLSMPPQVFGPVVDALAASGLTAGCPHTTGQSRLLIEKPFGYDLASAEELSHRISAAFEEDQIFRIDHYLAKDTVQNILAFRFHNPFFQAAWDRQHVARIIVTSSETIGVEGRAAFYESTGALRDVIQNHQLQLLALATMETPASLSADDVHAAKLALLSDITPPTADTVSDIAIRGQYATYRAEVDNPHSATETFAAIRLAIDNPRWHGVPVILATGKHLAEKTTHITFQFKGHEANQLTLRLEPNEGIEFDIMVKEPGLTNAVHPAALDFHYDTHFAAPHPDAYQRILLDAMLGDRTLFVTSAETIQSWRIIDPIVGEWAKTATDLVQYTPGTPIDQLCTLAG